MKYVRHFLEDQLAYLPGGGIGTFTAPPGVDRPYGTVDWIVGSNPVIFGAPGTVYGAVNLGDRKLDGSYQVPTGTLTAWGLSVVNADALRADAEILINMPVSYQTPCPPLIGVRCSGTAASPTGYFVEWVSSTTTLTLYYVNAGVFTSLGSFTVGSAAPLVRFRVNGTALKVKAWDVQTGSEAAAWNLEVVHGAITAAGNVCIGAKNTFGSDLAPGASYFFGSFATGGDTAPAPPKTWNDFLAFLELQDTMRCVLIDADPLGQTSGGAAQSARVCISNYPFVSGPDERYPNAVYEDVLLSVGDYTRRISESFMGRSTISRGDIVFANEISGSTGVGRLEAWKSWNWDGRPLRKLYGHPSWRRCDFKTINVCAIQDIYTPSRGRLGWKLRGKEELFNRSVSSRLIGGSGPNANSLSPTGFGSVFNVEPVWYDTNNLVLQLFSGDFGDLIALDAMTPEAWTGHEVRDGGLSLKKAPRTIASVAGSTITCDAPHQLIVGAQVTPSGSLPAPLVADTNYWVDTVPSSTQLTLRSTPSGSPVTLTTTTSGGTFIGRLYQWRYSGDGTQRITLLSPPEGRVTFSTGAGQAGGVVTTGLIRWLLIKTGLDAELDWTLTHGSLLAGSLAQDAPQRLGIWFKEQRSIGDVLDEIASSVGAYTFNRRTGLFAGRVFKLPTGTAAWTLTEDDVIGLQPRNAMAPAEVERLGYQKNYTVQRDGLLAAVTPADVDLFGREYSLATYTPSEAGLEQPANHLLRRTPPERATLLELSAEAATEAQRRYTMFRKKCQGYVFSMDAQGFAMEPGDELKLTHSEHGFAAGKNAVITAITDRALEGKCEVEIFCQVDGQWPVVSSDNPLVPETYY